MIILTNSWLVWTRDNQHPQSSVSADRDQALMGLSWVLCHRFFIFIICLVHCFNDSFMTWQFKNVVTFQGFEFLDPFVPILVPEYSEKEARSTIDYYIDRNWIQNDYGKLFMPPFFSRSRTHYYMKNIFLFSILCNFSHHWSSITTLKVNNIESPTFFNLLQWR